MLWFWARYCFITERIDCEGSKWAGPRIRARSWAKAEAKATRLGVALVGRLG